MKTILPIFFLLVFCFTSGIAQEVRPTGALPDDPYARITPVLEDTTPILGRPVLPEKYTIVDALPVPGHQGGVAACTGFTVAHAILLMNMKIDAEKAEKKRGSGSYIYNHVFQKDCKSGAYLSKAMSWAMKKGVCPLSIFKDNPYDCDPKPTPEHDRLAAAHRIDTFYIVFNEKTPAPEKIERVKRQLSYNKPVIIELSVDTTFFNLKTRDWRPSKKKSSEATHSLVVAGYDESGFLLMNSYGHGWGDKGYCTVKYADFLSRALNGYILQF